MIKLSDYITKRLVEFGIKDVFMISGGGAMHLVDSIGRQKGLRYICNHHEQACAIAAEGYFRASNKMAAVVVTSGPGGTNCLTGVIGQWLDSIPVIYISGQVKQETTIESCRELGLRQLGDQEINIVDIVRPVIKYAAIISKPGDVRFHLEKAFFMAMSGRPGPVWLEVPLNIQSAMVHERELEGYVDAVNSTKLTVSEKDISFVVKKLNFAQRPLIVAGHGIKLAGAVYAFNKLIKKLKVPVVTTFNGFDIMASDDPLFIGRIGTLGTRAGNFALQNADVVLEIGTRNNIRQISYNWDSFAKEAFKVIVDVDAAELQKPTVKPDMAVNCDAAVFIHELQRGFNALAVIDRQKWLRWCIKRKLNYDVVLPDYAKVKKFIQPYYFARTLTRILDRDDVVVAGNGTACITLFQAGIVKKGQKIFWNSGCASMGYDLPAAIGACFSGKGKRVICLAGDGSLQMNIQEFQTIVHHKLPLKLFVLNNQGYVSIQQTQDAFFDGNRVACCPKTGVSFPDIVAVAKAYGLRALRLHSHKGLERTITMFLAEKGPGVCEIVLTPGYIFSPKTSSKKLSDGRIVSSSLDDMYPFLERKEFLSNKIQGNIG